MSPAFAEKLYSCCVWLDYVSVTRNNIQRSTSQLTFLKTQGQFPLSLCPTTSSLFILQVRKFQHNGFVYASRLVCDWRTNHPHKSTCGHKNASPRVSQAWASVKSGLTLLSRQKSVTPTHVPMSRSSSRTAVLSSNLLLFTPVLARASSMPPSARADILAPVKGKVPQRPGCRPKCCG